MNSTDFYVYLIRRPDGRPCYVGKGRGKRWLKHAWRSTNPHLCLIYKNAGGVLPIEKLRDGMTEAEALAFEVGMISFHGREPHGPLVNLTDGGEGVIGHVHSPETRAKLSAAAKGHSRTKGIPKTADHRAALSAAKKGRKQSPELIKARTAPLRGRKRPPEVGAKISASKIGKKASEATRAALRAANRSRDPEVRARISAGVLARNAMVEARDAR